MKLLVGGDAGYVGSAVARRAMVTDAWQVCQAQSTQVRE
jgi:uncharacterized protein YbjT (DUF2867 family)